MKFLYFLILCFQTIITMAQYTEKELVDSYEHQQIASGERAKWDHANFYTTILLKEDGSFLKTRQQGRLSARFHYDYGTWSIEGNYVVVRLTHSAMDNKEYHKISDGDYKNDPYSPKLEKNEYSSTCRFEILNKWGDVIQGLKSGDTIYKK